MYEFEKLREGIEIGWKPVRLSDGSRHAIIICPKCKEEVFLGSDHGIHVIDKDGVVNPSVVHGGSQQYVMHNKELCGVTCGWHERTKLLDWEE